MKLTIVGLPLGNYKDLSFRALEQLKTTKLVICEDSRVFNRLWQKLQKEGLLEESFAGEYFVLNDFNEKQKATEAITRLQEIGEGILVSDAGLPTVSDPGYSLVNAVVEAGGELDLIPGPTAAMNALSISGLSADKVLFFGFLPKKTSKINKTLSLVESLKGQGITIIFYESPYRLTKTLEKLGGTLDPKTPTVIVRELTKSHQEIIRGTLDDIHAKYKKPKGEIVLLLRIWSSLSFILGIFTFRRERNPSEAEYASHSSASLRTRYSAKGDKVKIDTQVGSMDMAKALGGRRESPKEFARRIKELQKEIDEAHKKRSGSGS